MTTDHCNLTISI